MTYAAPAAGTASPAHDVGVNDLIRAKGDRTVSVVIPALNERATIAGVIGSIRHLIGGLVDELVVVDSGSTDDTIARARAAGASAVYTREEALPGVPVRAGKGEVLWRSLAVTTGDIVVFIDSDLHDPDPGFVPALVAPLLRNPGIQLVKGFYRRPLGDNPHGDTDGGGRVTQLVARPLLTALAPEVADVRQPLGGEYAATRALLTAVPFAPGYGVEIGILLDTLHRYGRAAIDEVDLGIRIHRNRPTHELAVMSRQIIATLLARLDIPDSGMGLTQFRPEASGWRRVTSPVSSAERPPLASLFTTNPAGG
ncbi:MULTISPECIES: glucosyl-3-phosphoglycerate synthase [Nocardia]|uniref:Glucosyl-3-phosphoglycerate synthase n=1 Tax=Nocardia nova TaxID=37330 RepID=A0A2T2YWM9_9NOCA|nr:MULTISPECIES: glucosyl-3-phosphoglycerate synthase [Nocardia]PSR59849.1 glucosyl-3-phosphoglycerate synthase [Nocardia nova]